MLYIVSTPIGNLKDITLRALEVLKAVDLIAAEDTRHTRKLCQAYDITTPLTSYFEHNSQFKGQKILEDLKSGKDVALVSDAGTPGISDPGYRLINLAQENEIEVTVVPGASACIAALTLSGLPSDCFTFHGFLPVKTHGRKNKIEALRGQRATHIFYESPHRIFKTLADIEEVLGDHPIVVVREISKKFEEVLKGSATEVMEALAHPKGEFVVLWNVK